MSALSTAPAYTQSIKKLNGYGKNFLIPVEWAEEFRKTYLLAESVVHSERNRFIDSAHVLHSGLTVRAIMRSARVALRINRPCDHVQGSKNQ